MAMMERNIFLDIIERKIPAKIIHEDEQSLAFHDISPQAPTHVIIIPKKVLRTHAAMTEDDQLLLGHLHWVAAQLAKQLGLESYRLVINCDEAAGQTVPHLHLHLLGGRQFGWPPG
jgi:histidine triad (HIT) family protein